jgi:hypothetical protein
LGGVVKFSFASTAIIGLILLTGCAAVDQYGSRIYDANLNSQNALNQEVLLNVVRASRFQSANFMAISQVTGGQTEMVSTGLPTVSFGPGQTAANHVYQVSNSVQSTVQGGYQSNPLISTAFQNGMMSPVSDRTIALLAASRPREIVFFLLLDGIEVIIDRKHFLLKNDPSQDLTLDDPRTCDEILADSLEKEMLGPGAQCSYTKFKFLLQSLIGNGLTAELVDSSGAANSGTGTSAANPSGLPGHFCFDPAVAGLNSQKRRSAFRNLCGPKDPKQPKPSLTRTVSSSVKTTEGKTETTNSTSTTGAIPEASSPKNVAFDIPYIGRAELRFVRRSPIGAINYLGIFLREGPFFLNYASAPAQRVLPDHEPYLSVVPFSSAGCYTSLDYMGQTYCVPATSAHTPMIMDMVEALRNLNIQPADVNSAFTVRLAP